MSSTSTEFSTIHSTSTIAVDVTVDNTITQTATVTVSETATVVSSITSTVYLPGAGTTHAKRAEAVIPAYASACSDSVRYSSACSCISATPQTTTIAASTTTVTVPTTVWAAETHTNVVTQDVPVTVPTTTTVIASMTTVTSVVATETITGFYLTIRDIMGTFYIESIDGNADPARAINDPARARRFELASDGTLWSGGRTLTISTIEGPQVANLVAPILLNLPGIAQFRCSINNSFQTLSCSIGNEPAGTWATRISLSNGQVVRLNGAHLYHATPEEYGASTVSFAQVPLIVSECTLTAHCGAGLTCQEGSCRA